MSFRLVPRRSLPGVLPGVVAFCVARSPSFLEPHWYTDEAGYATTAATMLRGVRLYSGAWTNKPPLHLLIVALPVALDDTSEALLHTLTFATGLCALLAAAWAATRLLTPPRALAALLAGGVFLGLPVFDAQLAVPESLLVAATTWAGALVLVRVAGGGGGPALSRSWWAAGVGLLAAAGVAIQQTAVADAAALGLVLLLSPRVRRRDLIVYAATVLGITVAWVVTVVTLAGAGTVKFALGGFYIQYTASVLPGTSAGLAGHVALLALALGLIVGGAVGLRRSTGPAWAAGVWAGATLLVPAAAQQPFPHFVIPAVLPVALMLGSVPVPRSIRPVGTRLAALALAAGVVVAGVMGRVAGMDWVPQLGLFEGHTLGDYYGGALGVATGRETLAAWQGAFDDRVSADAATAAWVRDHGLSGHRAVVWSSDAWPYLLADLPLLMPTAPIYNNEVLLGTGGPVADRVAALDPELIIVAHDADEQFPEIDVVLRAHYRWTADFPPDAIYVRDDGGAAP